MDGMATDILRGYEGEIQIKQEYRESREGTYEGMDENY
jgi:hypothetical protein